MPFWHGEVPRRDYHMGLRLGAFRRELAERVSALPPLPEPRGRLADRGRAADRLAARRVHAMDESSARNAILYVRQQVEVLGAISSDDTVIVELFTDALGDQRMAIHSCFGGAGQQRLGAGPGPCHPRATMASRSRRRSTTTASSFACWKADREPPVDLVRQIGARRGARAPAAGAAQLGAVWRAVPHERRARAAAARCAGPAAARLSGCSACAPRTCCGRARL